MSDDKFASEVDEQGYRFFYKPSRSTVAFRAAFCPVVRRVSQQKVQVVQFSPTYRTTSHKLNKFAEIEACCADLLHAKGVFELYSRRLDEIDRKDFANAVNGDNRRERAVETDDPRFIELRALFDSGCVALRRAFDERRSSSAPLNRNQIRKGMPENLKAVLNLLLDYRDGNAAHFGNFHRSWISKFWVDPPNCLTVQFNSYTPPGLPLVLIEGWVFEMISWIMEEKISPLYKESLKGAIKFINNSLSINNDNVIGIEAGRFKIIDNSEEHDESNFHIEIDHDVNIISYVDGNIKLFLNKDGIKELRKLMQIGTE